jgi:ribonuclease P protein component
LTSPGRSRQKQAARGWFDRAFAQKTAFSGRYLQLYVVAAESPSGRLGVSVSKRTSPSAVARNYVKRVLRAWYQSNRQKLSSMDIVIRVRRGYDRRDFPGVSRELDNMLQRFA